VPDVLLSGNHAAIRRWRHEQALLRTASTRPDLLAGLSADDQRLLANLVSGQDEHTQESQ
jgi:tRNA (guanine37-N1)-methyltransferase